MNNIKLEEINEEDFIKSQIAFAKKNSINGYVSLIEIAKYDLVCLEMIAMTKNIELLDIIKSLKNYDINNQDISYNDTMLIAYASKLEVAKYLLNKGANVDLQNNSGATALHNATLTHSFDVMELLLENGANPDISN